MEDSELYPNLFRTVRQLSVTMIIEKLPASCNDPAGQWEIPEQSKHTQTDMIVTVCTFVGTWLSSSFSISL